MSTIKRGYRLAVLLCLLGGSAPVYAAKDPPIPRTDAVIDIGHGGVDGGTSYGNILEKNINLDVGMRLYPILRKHGISAGLTRASDYALSDDNGKFGSRHRRDLSQRVKVANRLNPHMIISLHVNWANDRSKSGPLVIYRKNHEPSNRLAILIQQELNGLYGTEEAPLPGKKYYLLRHTTAPAVIIEMGYMSNHGDRTKLTTPDFQTRLADAVAWGVTRFMKEVQPDRFSRP